MYPSTNKSTRVLDLFINLSTMILDLSMNLSIRTLLIAMKPLNGNSSALFHMRDYILLITLMKRDIGIMLCLNGEQGRISQSLSLSIHEVTPSCVHVVTQERRRIVNPQRWKM